jgi:hypothetical protein
LTMHAKNSITSRRAACAFSGAFGGSWVCLGFTSDLSDFTASQWRRFALAFPLTLERRDS